MSHTPGPWTYSMDLSEDGSADSFDLSAPSSKAFIWSCGCCGGTNIDGPNAKANADLISAAPDLLEALEALVEYVDEMHRIGHIQRPVQSSNAVAAIAKARGGK